MTAQQEAREELPVPKSWHVGEQCREMGLVVGDVIEGRENGPWGWQVTRMRVLWIGAQAAVFSVQRMNDEKPQWTEPEEEGSWDLSCRQWYRIERALSQQAEEPKPVAYGDRLGTHYATAYAIPDTGVPPWMERMTPLYAAPITAAEIRDKALEEAAKVCEQWGNEKVATWADEPSMLEDAKARAWDATQCAQVIRALRTSASKDEGGGE